jgi:hypothetical protein
MVVAFLGGGSGESEPGDMYGPEVWLVGVDDHFQRSGVAEESDQAGGQTVGTNAGHGQEVAGA